MCKLTGKKGTTMLSEMILIAITSISSPESAVAAVEQIPEYTEAHTKPEITGSRKGIRINLNSEFAIISGEPKTKFKTGSRRGIRI